MYQTIKKSIEGDIKAMIFEQSDNMPTTQDGPNIFKLLMSFTIAASLQLSMMSFNQIITFDPATCNFNIPVINTKLTNLFMLATTNERDLSSAEKIQHLLTAYNRIKQPEDWAQWVRAKLDAFDEGTLTNCQTFMNAAALKYIKVSASNSGSFGGRSTTLADDIVAMVTSSNKRKIAPATTKVADKRAVPPDKSTSPSSSTPFTTHNKDLTTGKNYKVGDTKEWKGQTYHYCDAPNHRNSTKWHTHPTPDCRTRAKWIERGRPPMIHAKLANATDDDTALTDPTGLSGATPSTSGSASVADGTANGSGTASTDNVSSAVADVIALLASALSVAPNDHARNLIADALNSVHDNT
jgi:hypothetical protein